MENRRVMKKFKLGGLQLIVAAEIGLLVLSAMMLNMYLVVADIIPFLNLSLNAVADLGYIIIAIKYKKEFGLARNLAIIGMIYPAVTSYLVNTLFNISSYDDYITVLNLMSAISGTIAVLTRIALAKGVLSLIKQSGRANISSKYIKTVIPAILFLIASTCISVFSVFMDTQEFTVQVTLLAMGFNAVMLIYTGYIAVILNNKPIQHIYENSSYNPKNKTYNHNNMQSRMQSQTGRSTRDEVYKQFEG